MCLILPPPGLPFASLFALGVGSDDTLRLGRVGVPVASLDLVRAHTSTQSDVEIDGVQVLIQAHGRRVIASLSACAHVTLIPTGREVPEHTHPIWMPTLDTLLSQTWVRAGNAWFDGLGEAELDALERDGLAPDRLYAAIAECMSARCAGVLNQLDYFDAGVDNDPVLSRWSLFLATDAEGTSFKDVWLVTNHTGENDSSYRIIYDDQAQLFGLECTLESGVEWYMGNYGSFSETVENM